MSRSRSGRNDPCPCGSGKKYKRCCLEEESTLATADRRYQRAEAELAGGVLDYLDEAFDGDPLPWALDDWFGGRRSLIPEDPLDDETFCGQAFFDWMAFDWIPLEDKGPAADLERTWPVAAAYAEAHRGRLDADVAALIEARSGRTWSLWSVRKILPGGLVELENVLCRQRVTVLDAAVAEAAMPGSILFGACAEFQGVHFVTSSPVMVPPSWRLSLVEMREKLAEGRGWLTLAECQDYEDEIRLAYLSVVADLVEPRPPQLKNMEGDPLQFVRQMFRLRIGAEEAFERLCDLARSVPADELLADGDRDEQGRLVEIDFPWEKPAPPGAGTGDYMCVAMFFIQNNYLLVSTNSERRARNAKAMVRRRLGKDAEYAMSERQDAAEALARAKAAVAEHLGEEPVGQQELPPEMREAVRERVRAHEKDWVDQPISVLDGETPREAARTERGRELLGALLDDFADKAEQNPETAPDVDELRRQLGLAP